MRSTLTRSFRRLFASLPPEVQEGAREAYSHFLHDHAHPGLRFKKVHPFRPIYSVRITRDHRAVGVLENDEIVWFWIGDHSDYERLLRNL